MIIISVIALITYLCQVHISWNFELQLINNEATPIGSIIGWLFCGFAFGLVYYACLCFIALILWKIVNRNHAEANQSYTKITKYGKRFTKPKPSKYDEQIEIIWYHTLKYTCIIEVSLVTLMYMFGFIKLG